MGQKGFEITPDTKVRELLKTYPEAAKILYEMGFECLTCKGADEEPLRLAAQMHGFSPEDLIKIIKEKLARRGKKR
jgi:hybrid cluster-associated redox disulfide protein